MRILAVCLVVLAVVSGVSAFSQREMIADAKIRSEVAESVQTVHRQVQGLVNTLVFSAHSGVSSAHETLGGVHTLMHVNPKVSSSGFHAMAPSATCVNAVLALNATIYGSTCQSFISIFNGANPLNNPSQINANLNTVCTSTCLTSLASATNTVAASCQNTDAAAFTADINKLITFTTLLCVKDPANANNYCFAEFVQGFQPFQQPNAISTLTNAQLNAFCTPCTFIILNGFVASGAFSADVSANISAASLICSKDPVTNNYCVVELQSASQIFAGINTASGTLPQITNAQFEPLCSSCTKRFLTYVGTPVAVNLFNALCTMQGNNFCFVQDWNGLGNLVNQLQGASSNVQAACNDLSGYVNNVGCCINTLTAILGSVSATTAGGLNTLFTACNINLPGPCGTVTYQGTFSFVIKNLAATYYNNNMHQVNQAIIADVASNLGVSTTQVSVTSVTSYSSAGVVTGCTITITVTFYSSLEATTAVGLFNSNVPAGNFPMTATAQLGASSRIAPASPVSTSTSNSQANSNAPNYTNNSPAAQAAPLSFFAVAVAALLAVAFTVRA